MNSPAFKTSYLKKRHRAEKIFRFKAMLALIFAGIALISLFISIIIPASDGITQNNVILSFDSNIEKSEAAIAAKKSIQQLFPEIISSRDKRLLNSMLAPHAKHFVPININETVTKLIPLASEVDIWLKNPDKAAITPKKKLFIQQLQQRNLIKTNFNWDFFIRNDSRSPEKAGFYSAIIGSIFLIIICMAIALPIGIAAAIYLEEFAPKNHLTDFIEININNLAAVPSIIYGLLGLFLYLQIMQIPRSSALAGGLTLALMTMPIIIISTRIALKAVPSSIRNAALAIGATKLQMVFHHLLPQAKSGIITGTILGISRAIGETAPLLMIGMVAFIVNAPESILDPTTAMPVQIFIWSSSPEAGFVNKTAYGIVILIAILLCFNFIANRIRSNSEKKYLL